MNGKLTEALLHWEDASNYSTVNGRFGSSIRTVEQVDAGLILARRREKRNRN